MEQRKFFKDMILKNRANALLVLGKLADKCNKVYYKECVEERMRDIVYQYDRLLDLLEFLDFPNVK